MQRVLHGLFDFRQLFRRLKQRIHRQFTLNSIVEIVIFLHAIRGEHRQKNVFSIF